jgi:hypothetical protein
LECYVQENEIYMASNSNRIDALELSRRYVQEYEATGDEFDVAKQRKRLRKRLGVDGHMEDLMDTRELVKDEDLTPSQPLPPDLVPAAPATQAASELMADMEGAN